MSNLRYPQWSNSNHHRVTAGQQGTPISTVWRPFVPSCKNGKTQRYSTTLYYTPLEPAINKSPFFILTRSGTLVGWQLSKILMMHFRWVLSATSHTKVSEKPPGQSAALLCSHVQLAETNCLLVSNGNWICVVCWIRFEGHEQERTQPVFTTDAQQLCILYLNKQFCSNHLSVYC